MPRSCGLRSTTRTPRSSAKGLGYTVLVSSAGPVAIVSAVSREQVNAVADGLRERARAAATAHDTPPPGQYL